MRGERSELTGEDVSREGRILTVMIYQANLGAEVYIHKR